jgi:hypothetical protein
MHAYMMDVEAETPRKSESMILKLGSRVDISAAAASSPPRHLAFRSKIHAQPDGQP